MTPIFLATATALFMLAVALWFPQQRHNASVKRLRVAAERLRALPHALAASSPETDTQKDAALHAAIDETLLASMDIERTYRQRATYAGVALIVLVPLAAIATHSGTGSPHAAPLPTHASPTHAAGGSGAAPLIDHGTDLQAAIARLSDKLAQHPDDAEGWALLGRTYKAIQQYGRAREAFRRAVAAAPEDTDLAKEYAAAETPNPRTPSANTSIPRACAVSDALSACADGAQRTP